MEMTSRNIPNKRAYLNDNAIPTIFPVGLKPKKLRRKAVSKQGDVGRSVKPPNKEEHTDHTYVIPSQQELMQKLNILIEENKTLKKKLKASKQCVKNLREKCATLKEVVNDLERKDYIGLNGKTQERKKRQTKPKLVEREESESDMAEDELNFKIEFD